MSSPEIHGESIVSNAHYMEFLKIEVEHFYRAELHCEQRASWLLTIAVGGLALYFNAFSQLSDGRIKQTAQIALVIGSGFAVITILSALWALWPLYGSNGLLSRPWRRNKTMRRRCDDALPMWEQHLAAHRLRAEIKTVRVVWTLVCLLCSVFSSIIAILQNRAL